MEYLLLIYDVESDMAKMSEAELMAMSQDFGAYTQGIIQSGNFRGGQRLQPVATATTIRERNGKRTTTDGPFAETREQLGGFYLIEAKDLDEALAIAEKCPGTRLGSVEVRPIFPPPAG